MNETERKKMYHALRNMILRYRKNGKTDQVAIGSFAYEMGMPKRDVEEMYQILLDSERIPREIQPENQGV